jgi:hypothetical protein
MSNCEIWGPHGGNYEDYALLVSLDVCRVNTDPSVGVSLHLIGLLGLIGPLLCFSILPSLVAPIPVCSLTIPYTVLVSLNAFFLGRRTFLYWQEAGFSETLASLPDYTSTSFPVHYLLLSFDAFSLSYCQRRYGNYKYSIRRRIPEDSNFMKVKLSL